MPELTRDDAPKRYRRDPEIVCRRVATEIILVPIRNNVREVGLYRLNEVAAFVWDRLDGTRALEAIAAEVAGAFEVDAATARRDVARLIEKLEGMGGVHRV